MSDEEERWRNLALYKIYATDEEMGIAVAILLGIAAICGVVYGIWRLIQWLRPM